MSEPKNNSMIGFQPGIYARELVCEGGEEGRCELERYKTQADGRDHGEPVPVTVEDDD